jgi:hypothetical protein
MRGRSTLQALFATAPLHQLELLDRPDIADEEGTGVASGIHLRITERAVLLAGP